MKLSLEQEQKKFYNSNKDYFTYSRSLNAEMTEERREAFRFIPNGSLVLDIGCGTAENGKYISEFAGYVGIDLSGMALDMAMDYKSKNFNLIRGDVSKLPLKPNSFDVVLSTYSLEHFLSPRNILDGMYEVCKKDGIIIIISPAWDLPFKFPPSINLNLNSHKRLFFSLVRVFEDLFSVI